MSGVTYHLLTAENAALLTEADVFDNPVAPAQLQRFVDDAGHHLSFATSADRVIGFASGTVLLHPDKDPAFFVNEVDVTPDMQRQGIATELCTRLVNHARAAGCRGIWLATEGDNTPARGLYRKLNASETGDIVVYDWDGALDVPAQFEGNVPTAPPT